MKITELISVFKHLLPIYKEAYEKDLDKNFYDQMLSFGICNAGFYLVGDNRLYTVFKDYYVNLTKGRYLYPLPSTNKDLKPRIDFMESEIKDLKRLLKKGYTHV
jgi:hypothetical protein